MSIAKVVKNYVVSSFEPGKPFSGRELCHLGSRRAVDCTLARLVEGGAVIRVNRGVYMRPKSSRYVSNVAPGVDEIIQAIAKGTNETIGISGAEAAQRLKLTTQVPMMRVYHTSGATREISVNNQRVRLKHVAGRKLAKAGTSAGMALSALWYLGKDGITESALSTIARNLSPAVLEEIETSNVPAWMSEAIRSYRGRAYTA